MDKGEIVKEEGTHDMLMKQNGIYAELYHSKEEDNEKYA